MAVLTDEQILDADLMSALGLASASDDDRTQVVNNVVTLVLKTAMLEILDSLPEDKRRELARIIEKHGADSKEVTSFLETGVPNLASILQNALISVKRNLINRSQKH